MVLRPGESTPLVEHGRRRATLWRWAVGFAIIGSGALAARRASSARGALSTTSPLRGERPAADLTSATKYDAAEAAAPPLRGERPAADLSSATKYDAAEAAALDAGGETDMRSWRAPDGLRKRVAAPIRG